MRTSAGVVHDLSFEPDTRRLVAHVLEDGRLEVYDCAAGACDNPVCRCRTTTVAMRHRSASAPRREIRVDLDAMAINAHFRKRASPEHLTFAERLVAAMDGADFQLLDELHSFVKPRFRGGGGAQDHSALSLR
jgi:hypothetical protein